MTTTLTKVLCVLGAPSSRPAISPINFQMTKLRLKAGNDSNHDKEIIKAEDESKNEGTASVNTEDMGEVAKESSEEEVEVGKEALVDKDVNIVKKDFPHLV